MTTRGPRYDQIAIIGGAAESAAGNPFGRLRARFSVKPGRDRVCVKIKEVRRGLRPSDHQHSESDAFEENVTHNGVLCSLIVFPTVTAVVRLIAITTLLRGIAQTFYDDVDIWLSGTAKSKHPIAESGNKKIRLSFSWHVIIPCFPLFALNWVNR